MSGDGIGFAEISDVHRDERRSKVLTKLPGRFYTRAEQYLAQRREEYAKSASHSSPAAMMLQDEIKKIDKRLKQIYEMRERKIVLASLSGVRPDNMASKDKALYQELAEVLEHYRGGGVERAPKVRETVNEPVLEEAPVVECQTEFADEADEEEDVAEEADSAIVQVLEDIPPFVDVDHTYILKKDDIVTIPSQFASLLSSKGKVRIVES